MENLLTLENLSKQFNIGSFELKNINLNLKANQIVGLIGENGSGKSTLLNTIVSRYVKTSGNIYFFNQKINFSKKDYKDKIGVVFDTISLPNGLNVIQLEKILSNIFKNWESKLFFEYINMFDLPETNFISNFSRGMSMKLSIAVALSHKPRILFLDEATAGLDISSRKKINSILKKYVSEGNSILLTSHIVDDIEEMADKLIFLKKGEILLEIEKNVLLKEYSIIKTSDKNYINKEKENILAYSKNSDTYEVLIRSNINTLEESKQSIDDITEIIMNQQNFG
ncbi:MULTISPECIES: ABC transporter ATP-binding protein [Staphylococcus]|uniref:ABC transporter ATP-binding protein n=1 Tax=Staphylococcus TaxID=1279 RepID=UPI0013007933|nr:MULTISPECIES: ABC transporter ATP-binding protein [Staphylococcus]